MRIRKISIESFGTMRDRSFDLGNGLNVVYGPNESGKTTLMEFIRNILVPTTKKNRYPERTKKDAGELLYSEDGEEKAVRIDYNDITGDSPVCLVGMDPDLYRTVFAMNQAGLDNLEAVSNDDIRSRFLTIPGGESMPDVISAIEGDVESLLGKKSNSPSRINSKQAEEDTIYQRIGVLRSNAESYSSLCEQRDELQTELSMVKDKNRELEKSNRMYDRVESQRSAFRSLADYRSRKAEAMWSKTVSPQNAEEHDRLVSDSQSKRAAFEALDESRRKDLAVLSISEAEADRVMPRIDSVLSRRAEYVTRSNMKVPEKKRGIAGIAVPAILLAIGLVMLLFPELGFEVRLAAAGGLIVAAAVSFLLLGRSADPQAKQNAAWLEGYRNEVSSIASSLRLPSYSVEESLSTMSRMSDAYRSLQSNRRRWSDLQVESMKADNSLLEFLSRFGGAEGYSKALENTASINSLDSRIDALVRSIKASGLDPDQPIPDVEHVELDRSRESELGESIGSLNEKIKSTLDTDELDALIDRSYTVRGEKEKILRRGAVAMLSSYLVQEACTEQYEGVHPEVVTLADSYLSMMTSGKYRLDTDPRISELSVVSSEGTKGPKQWSSGLRAQVLLSIKLAVAREMGKGEVPMILDDVLLPFDDRRKEGALQALSRISEDMQVLLFSCDSDVKETAEKIDGCHLIEM